MLYLPFPMSLDFELRFLSCRSCLSYNWNYSSALLAGFIATILGIFWQSSWYSLDQSLIIHPPHHVGSSRFAICHVFDGSIYACFGRSRFSGLSCWRALLWIQLCHLSFLSTFLLMFFHFSFFSKYISMYQCLCYSTITPMISMKVL